VAKAKKANFSGFFKSLVAQYDFAQYMLYETQMQKAGVMGLHITNRCAESVSGTPATALLSPGARHVWSEPTQYSGQLRRASCDGPDTLRWLSLKYVVGSSRRARPCSVGVAIVSL
jgi:hypothetical protein